LIPVDIQGDSRPEIITVGNYLLGLYDQKFNISMRLILNGYGVMFFLFVVNALL